MAAILVIDHYDGFRDAMSYCLPQFGHAALLAADREAALRIADEHAVDVVLLDLGYRQQTGFLVCAALKRHARLSATPVILMGDLVTPESRLRAVEVGAEAMVEKPLDWPEFLELIDRLVLPTPSLGGEEARGES